MQGSIEINMGKFLGQTSVDPSDPGIATMMAGLQGNILKGHGRSHVLLIFFRFSQLAQLDAVRNWLSNLTQNWVTTALDQFEEINRFRRTHESGSLFCNLFLTLEGYKAFGVAEAKIPPDLSFRAGMKARTSILADPPIVNWEESYRQEVGKEIHGMILLADPDANALADGAELTLNTAGGESVIEVLQIERGTALFTQEGQAIEHFGYADGRSQPLFFKEDIQKEIKHGDGTDLWDPSAPLSLVLAKDPASPNPLAFGSYLVFRKLEQNVAGFRTLKDALARRLEYVGVQPVAGLAGALVVGRHEDGTPVTLQAADGLHTRIPNNFNYDEDLGLRCPFHAHIRKANPRKEEAREHRIVRRGITYGVRNLVGEKSGVTSVPTQGVGLLFMCFQVDLSNQFEFIQDNWANAPGFPGDNLPVGGVDHHGIDPIAGQFEGMLAVEPQRLLMADLPSPAQPWLVHYGLPSPAIQAPFWGFVKLLGGEYFFTPSLSGLLALAESQTESIGAAPQT